VLPLLGYPGPQETVVVDIRLGPLDVAVQSVLEFGTVTWLGVCVYVTAFAEPQALIEMRRSSPQTRQLTSRRTGQGSPASSCSMTDHCMAYLR